MKFSKFSLSRTAPPSHFLSAYLLSLGIIALITFFGYLIRDLITPTNLVMPYMLGVMSIAILYGRGPAVFASVWGVIAFDIFLVPPYLTFVVEDTEYIITFLALFLVSVVISNLASQIKDQMRAAQEREARMISLYNLSNDLAVAYSLPDVLSAIIDNIKNTLKHDIWIFLVDMGRKPASEIPDFEIVSAPGTEPRRVYEAIRYTYKQGLASGYGTQAFATENTVNLPLNTNSGLAGVLSIAVEGPDGIITTEKFQLFEAYANLFTLALERIYLSTQTSQMQLLKAKEEFQSTLLSSISHDFRTPLVTITGTLSSLNSDDHELDQDTQRNLLRYALLEAEKLNWLVSNLLNMSRLESGALILQSEPVDVQDLIGAALEQMKNRINCPIDIQIPDKFPMISADFVLLQQAMINILDNSLKYSPEGSPVEISVYEENERIYIDIADQGIGIPESEIPHVFEKFYRVKDSNRPSGTGLGLAIAKGIIDIHQAGIQAIPNKQGGMIFRVWFPRLDLTKAEMEA
ncbi:MAG: DUF4118 domain-containing protein [Anaerolineales bacterium]|nr:DUF4118 domain-containing protein [Anaerolineales bacterium]